MIRGLYTAAAGMIGATLAGDVRANNLANVSTAGFKKNGVNFQSFPEMLIRKFSQGQNQEIGSVMTGSKVRETVITFTQGQLHQTGNTFDIALEGDGFFTLKESLDPNSQTFYSRSGNFTVNAEGYLTTMSGQYVQGKLGPLQLNLDQGPFTINAKGQLTGKNRALDSFAIARFEDNNALQKLGDTMFVATGGATEKPEAGVGENTGYKVHQGYLELSNTNAISELVYSIEGLRHYESLQRNIKMQNETLGKAVNEVGRTR